MSRQPLITYINVDDPGFDIESPEMARMRKSIACISYQEDGNTILESRDGSKITLDRETAKKLGEWLINTAFKDLGSDLFAYFLTPLAPSPDVSSDHSNSEIPHSPEPDETK